MKRFVCYVCSICATYVESCTSNN